MYNLLVTADPEAWQGRRSTFPVSRFGEYTAESLKSKFRALDSAAIAELVTMPTLFAHERQHRLPGRIGRIARITLPSGDELRFEYEISEEIPPIPFKTLEELDWELDVNSWEMNRTHWAIKDVDLTAVLQDAGIIAEQSSLTSRAGRGGTKPIEQGMIAPRVFAIPNAPFEQNLVAVMMPFSAEFSNVYQAIRTAAVRAGFECQRADDIWEDASIIQDVFSLIYRSAVVVVDLSGTNPNVMYETGIAHTLGRPVVPIANSVDRLPFDLAHHRTLGYLPNAEGLEELTGKLERKLRHLRA